MTDDRLRYALSEDQSAQIFRVLIRPEYLPDDLGAAQSPTAVLLGGQPGAGKSKLLHEATSEFAAKGPTVRINGDDLRDFHPRYTELQNRDPLNAARYTDADSGRWVEKLIEAAAERNVNLVIEGTMRRPEVVERTAALLREAGYRVEARAMAVPPEVSWQGVHQRFEATMAAGEAPRFSARQTHAAAVSGAVETLRQAEAGKLVDRIEVSNRAGSKLYENELKAGAWEQREKTAAETVRAEHQRGFSADELAAFEARWPALVSQMKERAAPADDLDRVSREAAADIAAVRARSVEQAKPPSVATTTEQRSEQSRGVVLPLRAADRQEERTPARTTAARRSPFAGLKLGTVREATEGPDLTRAAQDYARAWAEAERMRTEGEPVLPEQRQALDAAADVLRRLRPEGPDDLVAALEQEAHERRAAEARTAAVGTGPDERRGTRGPKSPDQDRDAGSDRLERVVAMVADRVLETLARRDAARPTAMGQTKSPSEAQEPGRSQTPGKAKARQAETKHEINTPEQQANVTPEWLIPPRTETKLSEAEIAERARSSSVMERQRDVIAERSRIVMGSDQPGKDLIAEVEKNPSAAFEISRRFAASPATEAGLAGRPGSWIRSESRERQAARAELPQLAHAVDDYGRSLVSERARVVREHEADERRNQVGVPAPSPFLIAALEAKPEQQTKMLSAASVRQELSSLNLALHERLSTRERQAIATNDGPSLSKSLGVPSQRVEAVMRTIRAVQEAAQKVQAVGRQPSRGAGITLSQ